MARTTSSLPSLVLLVLAAAAAAAGDSSTATTSLSSVVSASSTSSFASTTSAASTTPASIASAASTTPASTTSAASTTPASTTSAASTTPSSTTASTTAAPVYSVDTTSLGVAALAFSSASFSASVSLDTLDATANSDDQPVASFSVPNAGAALSLEIAEYTELFRVSASGASGTVYLRAGAKSLILNYYRQLSYRLLVVARDVTWTLVPVSKASQALPVGLNVSVARTSAALVSVDIPHGAGVITPVGTVIFLTLFTWTQTFWFWWAVAGCALLALLVLLLFVALIVLLALTCVRLRAYKRTYGGRSKADSVSHSFHGELGPDADADADAAALANADSFLPDGSPRLPLGADPNLDADAELDLQLQLARLQPQPQLPPLPRPVPPPRRVYGDQLVRPPQVTAQLHPPPHMPLEAQVELPYGAGADEMGNERDFFYYQQVGTAFEPQPQLQPAAASLHSPSIPSFAMAPLGSYTNPQLELEPDVGPEVDVRTERPRGPPPPPPQAYQPPAFAAGFTQPGAYQLEAPGPRSGAYEPRSGAYQPRSGAYQPRSGAYQPRSGANKLEAPAPPSGAYPGDLIPQPQSFFADDSECVATEI